MIQREPNPHPNTASREEKPTGSTGTFLLTARELVEREWPEPQARVSGLIPAGEIGILAGRQKKGKSTLMRQLSLDVALGSPFLGRHPTCQGKVLYVDFENKPRQIKDSLLRLVPEGTLPEELVIQTYEQIVRRDLGLHGEGLHALQTLVRDQKPDLLVIDPLRLALGHSQKLDDDKALLRVVEACQSLLSAKLDMAVVLVHHLKKTQDPSGRAPSLLRNPDGWIDQVYGGQALLGHVEFILGLDEDKDGLVLASVQRSQAPLTLLLRKSHETLRFSLREESARIAQAFSTEAQRDLWERLPDEFRYAEADAIADSHGLLDEVLKKGVFSGLLDKPERGLYVKVHSGQEHSGIPGNG